MSNLIHCDGPSCDRTLDADGPDMPRLCEEPWIRVRSDGLPRLDFHSQACLAAWSNGKPAPQRDSEPCMCNGAQLDPHTKAEHQPYPTTTVDGR